MTTESQHTPTAGGTGVLLRSAAVVLPVVVAAVVLAALVSGAPGAAGAATGGAVALVVFLAGSLVVNAVAAIAPGLSLLFALSTYVVQVLALGLVFAVLERRGAVGDAGDPGAALHAGWLGATIIAVTVVWLVAQVVLVSRARIPVYDLPSRAGER